MSSISVDIFKEIEDPGQENAGGRSFCYSEGAGIDREHCGGREYGIK